MRQSAIIRYLKRIFMIQHAVTSQAQPSLLLKHESKVSKQVMLHNLHATPHKTFTTLSMHVLSIFVEESLNPLRN